MEDIRRKRAYYRACHRGTKEMDLLLGRYAETEIANMREEDLHCFEELLSLPDPVLDGMIRGGKPADQKLAALIEKIQTYHGIVR